MAAAVVPQADSDVIVVGAGPAGLTAGIYAARAGLSVTIMEQRAAGGQMAATDVVENYPGCDEPVGGFDLGERMRRQAERFGCALREAAVTALEPASDSPLVGVVTAGERLSALAVIAASGAVPRRLGVPGEERFWGRGVSCCATCDGMFYRGKRVVVVGGGNTAVKEAVFLTRFARHITLVHRRDRLRAAHADQERLAAHSAKVEYLFSHRVTEILGGERVEGVRVEAPGGGGTRELACDGVFLFVGYEPSASYLPEAVQRDGHGYVVTDEEMRTSVPGILACGDVRRQPLRQIVTACAGGAVAAFSAQHRIDDIRGTAYGDYPGAD